MRSNLDRIRELETRLSRADAFAEQMIALVRGAPVAMSIYEWRAGEVYEDDVRLMWTNHVGVGLLQFDETQFGKRLMDLYPGSGENEFRSELWRVAVTGERVEREYIYPGGPELAHSRWHGVLWRMDAMHVGAIFERLEL